MTTHSTTTGHTAEAPFPPETFAAFSQEDKLAAGTIVCLMAGIFTLGLIGYLCVCFWVA